MPIHYPCLASRSARYARFSPRPGRAAGPTGHTARQGLDHEAGDLK
jgi:hypothetical protein